MIGIRPHAKRTNIRSVGQLARTDRRIVLQLKGISNIALDYS